MACSKFRVDGKIALVTGAASGIGKACAEVLARNGAAVAVNDISAQDAEAVACELVKNNCMALPLQADVSDLSQVSRMVAKILKVYGTIDILVNNAGILFPTSFEEMTEREWDKVIAVNLKGAFNCCKAVIAVMKKKRYGKIVNISSSAGKSTSTFGGAHYTASKAGLLGLTRHLAREVGRYGINVNAVCPGSIDTPMIRSKFTDEQIRSAIEKIPMGRLGTPEEVAYLVLFLASDASSYITGASIDINAGELMV